MARQMKEKSSCSGGDSECRETYTVEKDTKREGGRLDDKTGTEAMQTWVTERMPGRQAAQRIEKPSRGSQRAISDTQEPQEERWREEEKIVDMGEIERG